MKKAATPVSRRLLRDKPPSGRAACGKPIVATVSQELTVEFGAGFNDPVLTRMARFAEWMREVARQIDRGLFECAVLNPPKLSTALRERREGTHDVLKKRAQGVRAAHDNRNLVTVSRELTMGSDRHFKRKRNALLEGAPA